MIAHIRLVLLFALFINSIGVHAGDQLNCVVVEHATATEPGLFHVTVSLDIDQPTTIEVNIYSSVIPSPGNFFTTVSLEMFPGLSKVFSISGPPGTYTVEFAHNNNRTVCQPEILEIGCTDADATNYNPDATISDNGNCAYETDVCPTIFSIDTTPPDCGEQNGSITIRSSGENLRFSIDGGVTFSSGGTFDNLGQGTYTLVANNPSEGCSDTEHILLYCGDWVPPEGSCPEIIGTAIDQLPSTCNSSDGVIVVSTSNSFNRFRLAGVTPWTHSPIITGVPSGTHTIEVINTISGCSTSGSVTVGCIPSCSDGRRNGTETGVDCGGSCAPCCPEGLGVAVVNYPYCPSDTDGSISVGARGVNLQYSINNGASWSTNPVFTNLRGNTSYAVKVRSTSRGCEELSLSYFLPCEERCPRITGIQTMTVANCDITESGVIQINLAEGQGNVGGGKFGDVGSPIYEYSIDGGNTWSGNNIYTVSSGTFTVLVRNNETGCGPIGQVVTIACTSCFDGIQNGDETGIDCGGSYCHVCEGCPSVAEIKASETQNSGGGSDGGKEGGRGKSGGFEGSGSGDLRGFICDQDDYRDCPNCISYRSCHDELDNDGDDLCDCADPDCAEWFDAVCVKPKEECEDGIDNDGDSATDCADGDCADTQYCPGVGDGRESSVIEELKSQFILAAYAAGIEKDLPRYHGVPHWDHVFSFGNALIIPIAKYNSYNIGGAFIAFLDGNGKYKFHFISMRKVLAAIGGEKSFEDRAGSVAAWSDPYFELEDATLLLIKTNKKLNGGIDVRLAVYVESSNKSSTSENTRSGICTYEVCFTYCEEWEQLGDVHTYVGGIPVLREITDEQGNVLRLMFETQLGLNCHSYEQRCRAVSFPCDDGTFPPDINPGDFVVGEGTGGSGQSASTSFFDRLKDCPNTLSGGGGEGSAEVSFCTALRDLRECTVLAQGFWTSENYHNLEALGEVEDCDPGHPLQDDQGMLTEAASFLCDFDGNINDAAEVITEYAEYAAIENSGEALCLDDYLKVSQLIEEYDLEITVAELLEQFDLEDCLEAASGCEDPTCADFTSCLRSALSADIANSLINSGSALNFDSPTLETDLERMGLTLGQYQQIVLEIQILQEEYKAQHGEYCNNTVCRLVMTTEATFRVQMGVTHDFLDLCGLIPGVGEPCDGVNAVLFTMEGDFANAALSAAALIPGQYWTTGSRVFHKILRKANGRAAHLTWQVGDDGFIKFGTKTFRESAGHLRSVLNAGKDKIAHHIIPWSLKERNLVQRAAQFKDNPFHINDLLNGIPLPKDQHGAGYDAAHRLYNDMIRDHMETLFTETMTPREAYDALATVIARLRSQLEQGLPLDQIVLP